MPEIKHYIVHQTRMVRVTANSSIDAMHIAIAAFEHGQDSNGGISKDNAPPGIWGDTDTRVENVETTVKRVS